MQSHNPKEALDLSSLPSVPLSDRRNIPSIPGIYFAIDSLGVVQYIGRAKNPIVTVTMRISVTHSTPYPVGLKTLSSLSLAFRSRIQFLS